MDPRRRLFLSVLVFALRTVAQLSLSLLSISKSSNSGFDVVLSSSSCVVHDRKSKEQIWTGRRVADLYVL